MYFHYNMNSGTANDAQMFSEKYIVVVNFRKANAYLVIFPCFTLDRLKPNIWYNGFGKQILTVKLVSNNLEHIDHKRINDNFLF